MAFRNRRIDFEYFCCNGLVHIMAGARCLLFVQIIVIICVCVEARRLASYDNLEWSMAAMLMVVVIVAISTCFYYGLETEQQYYLLPYLVAQILISAVCGFAACVILLLSLVEDVDAIRYFFDSRLFIEILSNDDSVVLLGLRLAAGCLFFGVLVQLWFFSIALDCFRYILLKRRNGYIGRFDKLDTGQSNVAL